MLQRLAWSDLMPAIAAQWPQSLQAVGREREDSGGARRLALVNLFLGSSPTVAPSLAAIRASLGVVRHRYGRGLVISSTII